MNLLALHLPELRPHRLNLVTAVHQLCQDVAAARFALKVTASRDADIHANARLPLAPTMPALHRYTGVLFAALDVPALSVAQQARAQARIVIMSALFGPIRGGDLIPAYRLSATTNLPGIGVVSSYWRRVLAPLVTGGEAVLDLRSAAYAAFAPVPAAITVRVVTERADGTRVVVSHFNKHTKGLLARAVATPRAEVDSVDDVVAVAQDAGLRAEQVGDRAIEILT